MSGPGFAFKWNAVNPDVDWQLTQSKSYGDGIQTINNAMNAFADSTRKQNTDALLMQIAQANDPTALGNTGILAGIDPLNRTVAGADVLKEFMTRDDALRTKQANTMATDFLLNNTTNLDFIKERSELEGITPEYMGPIANLVTQQRANAAAAAQQAAVNKREDIKVASQVSKTNSDIEVNNANILEKYYKNQGEEKKDVMYDENGKAYPVTTRTPSMAQVGGAGSGSSSNSIKLSSEQEANMDTTWKALKANNVSDTAAQYLLAEIGREGSFNNANIYGNHADPKAKRTNSGIISWSDPGRRAAFLSSMKADGHLNPDGSMKQSPEALTAQVNFMVQEMKNHYPEAYKALQRNDLTDQEADKLFGGGYIGWARKDPEFSAKGYQNRSDFLGAASSRYGGNGNTGGGAPSGPIDAAVNGKTSGEVSNPFSPESVIVPSSASTKGAKGEPPKLLPGVGFAGNTVLEAQSSMKAAIEASNAKNTIAKAKPSKVQESEFQQFLAKGGYTGNEILNRNAELYGTLKNFDEFNKMPGSEKKALLEYLTNENQKGWGLSGRLSAKDVKAKVERYKSDRKFDAAATAKQEAFTALNLAATKLYHANVGRFPNITMQLAREAVDKKLAKDYADLNKDKKGS